MKAKSNFDSTCGLNNPPDYCVLEFEFSYIEPVYIFVANLPRKKERAGEATGRDGLGTRSVQGWRLV